MHNRYLKLGSTSQNGTPFICRLIPFICSMNPAILPLICKKQPLVCIRGFSLIELIVTMTIAGILIAVAAPSMSGFVSSNRLAAQVNDLIADINLSRSEAIKQNATAGVCKTAVGGASCVTAGTWANGWMVYATVGTVTTVIKTHESLSGNNTLTALFDSVVYAKSGLLSSPTGVSNVITLCDPKMKKTRVLTLLTTGRPTLSEGTC